MSLPSLYDRLILRHPGVVLLCIALLIAVAGWYTQFFRLDASSDSLVLENDSALSYYRAIRARYGSDDFLVVTYTPVDALFDDTTLADLSQLRDELAALQRVDSVNSILDVPLINSPPVKLAQLNDQVPTLESDITDKSMARKELLNSPLYSNRLISSDAGTTAIQINLVRSEKYNLLLERRNQLREQQLSGPLSAEQRRQMAEIEQQFEDENRALQQQFGADVQRIRSIMDDHRSHAELHLGGVPMIIADSIRFIHHDLVVFGAGVGVFIIIILAFAFRKPRWVVLPMLTCVVTGVSMVGLLGWLDWPVTVVSANFLSLLLIITLSLTIHLIVRYRELQTQQAYADQYRLVRDTIHSKAQPCFYTTITTMVAFGSLLISDVSPVIDFGWMMFIGIAIAFVFAFTLFPCLALLLKPDRVVDRSDWVHSLTGFAARLVERHGNLTLIAFGLLTVSGVAGISLLSVENSFIDYFKSSTEIHQGMKLIDRELGGTTPLDIIVDAPADFNTQPETSNDTLFEEEWLNEALTKSDSGGIAASSYWFNTSRLEQVSAIHNSIDQLQATGKVLSIDTTVRMLRQLSDDDMLDDFFLSILYKRLPDSIKQQLIDPYMSEDGNQLRFAVRVFESDSDLNRDQLLTDIRQRLSDQHSIAPEQMHITGMMVLYNNVLHSLFRSQIMTVGVVFVVILLMFIVLFRNIRLSLIAIIPNIFAAILVLGLIGWMRIPLDIMTVTIAAVCIGIAVDDTIHYIHRYRDEFSKDQDYHAAVLRSHASIGRALFYTSLTITLGFSILVLSNFVPTIYFGFFTGIAMLAAMIADLTLLPLLITRFKPLSN